MARQARPRCPIFRQNSIEGNPMAMRKPPADQGSLPIGSPPKRTPPSPENAGSTPSAQPQSSATTGSPSPAPRASSSTGQPPSATAAGSWQSEPDHPYAQAPKPE